jgi:hypothetical protein
MKRALLLAVLSASLAGACAEEFRINWYSVDGGGGTSAGADFVLTSTIGQADAGFLSGGEYSLAGGFWTVVTGVVSPPEPGPRLMVSLGPDGAVILQWPSSATGFVLQHSSRLTPNSWSDSDIPVDDDGISRSVILERPAELLFFRLHKAQ